MVPRNPLISLPLDCEQTTGLRLRHFQPQRYLLPSHRRSYLEPMIDSRRLASDPCGRHEGSPRMHGSFRPNEPEENTGCHPAHRLRSLHSICSEERKLRRDQKRDIRATGGALWAGCCCRQMAKSQTAGTAPLLFTREKRQNLREVWTNPVCATRSSISRKSNRRQDLALNRPKPDSVPIALAPAGHDHRVAVLQERPLLARLFHHKRIPSAPSQLKQRPK